MKKKIALLTFSILLLSLIVMTYSTKVTIANDEVVIHVDCKYTGQRETGSVLHPYKTIRGGLKSAHLYGHSVKVTVQVWNGTYEETEELTIQRPLLNLLGENIENTIIKPKRGYDIEHVIGIFGNNIPNTGCNISGFTIDEAPEHPEIGIKIVDVTKPTNIYENKIQFNDYAIIITNHTVSSCANINITGNILVDNNPYGIWMESCSDSLVSTNTIDGHFPKGPGIHMSNVQDSIIVGNVLTNHINAIELSEVQNISIFDNDIVNCSTGVKGSYSDFNNITDNRIQFMNTDGIFFEQSANNTFKNNAILDCTLHGVYLEMSQSGGTIENNFLYKNARGILLVNSNHTSIGENTILESIIGVEVNRAFENVIYHNSFLNNMKQVIVEKGSTNSWDKGEEGGNYWSDCVSEDRDGNGFGDDSYVLDDNNQDNYPLIVPTGPIPIFWNGERYDCVVKSRKLTISGFSLDQESKHIQFNVTGHGYCNLTVPRNLLEGAFCISANNSSWPCITTWNETMTSICFQYGTSIPHMVKITGKEPLTWDYVRKLPEMQEEISNAPDLNGDDTVGIRDLWIVAKQFGLELENS